MPAPSRCLIFAVSSPSLRGSGLKSRCRRLPRCCGQVSLFTREWIEIGTAREHLLQPQPSPSLRGSGLKSASLPMVHCQSLRLPLYEGVD